MYICIYVYEAVVSILARSQSQKLPPGGGGVQNMLSRTHSTVRTHVDKWTNTPTSTVTHLHPTRTQYCV